MEVTFTKLADDRHEVAVVRADGSTERRVLDSRSFLRHDLAHWAVEAELGLAGGFWGSVAGGASLAGEGLAGPDLDLAERLSGPVQTLMRTGAEAAAYRAVVERLGPAGADPGVADRVHERVRALRGHWNATPYGGAMTLTWPAAAPEPAGPS